MKLNAMSRLIVLFVAASALLAASGCVNETRLTEVIDPLDQDSDHIRFGATVTVQPSSGPGKVYQIVGIDEADIERGRISWTSPLARSLLDGKAGDIIKVSTPAGEQELEIIEVRYLEIL